MVKSPRFYVYVYADLYELGLVWFKVKLKHKIKVEWNIVGSFPIKTDAEEWAREFHFRFGTQYPAVEVRDNQGHVVARFDDEQE